MKKAKLAQMLAVALTLTVSVGCSGSSNKSVKSASSTPLVTGTTPVTGTPDTGTPVASTPSKGLETVIDDTAAVLKSEGDGIVDVGRIISELDLPLVGKVDLPLVGGVTDGLGNVVSNVGDGVNSLATGLSDGLGAITTNDNAIGTTLAGVTGTVSETGEAVSSLKTSIDGISSLPIFAQLDASTGLLTDLGGTATTLGGTVTAVGDQLTFALTNPDGTIGGLTTELTAVVRPLFTTIDGETKAVGDALVIGPLASNLLEQVGTAVIVLGSELSKNAVLAGT